LDKRNTRNLLLAVDALVSGKRLTLMELARHCPGFEYVHAPLKRMDRLLGNSAVQAQRRRFYQAAVMWVLRSPRPIVIVDWSELKADGRWHLLRAGVVCRGRTLTLYEEVHPEARKNHPQVESAFLQHLKLLLPASTCPVIVTDAGFRVPWFRAVETLGWHWIGRVRHRNQVRFINRGNQRGPWITCTALHAGATHKARRLGDVDLTQSNALRCQLTLIRKKKAGRQQITRYGQRSRSGHSCKMARSANEPWLLASSCSLSPLSAAQIVAIYGKRMQIEQSFRDLKSHRYGCAFEDTLTRHPRRLEMLLLIHMLANLVAWLCAMTIDHRELSCARQRRLNRHYSLLWRGWDFLRRARGRCCFAVADAMRELRGFTAWTA
jgi:hypothetical protein